MKRTVGILLATTAVSCGSDGATKPAGPPPAKEASSTVSAVLNQCIETSYDDAADTSQISRGVDKLIRLFKRYDPDAQLGPSDLKARTMRQVLESTREILGDCKPAEVDRVNETLTSK